MGEFEFTLILEDQREVTDELENRIYKKCDDCTISSRAGVVYVAFCRESKDLNSAILSAIRQICEVGSKVRRVDLCNLVTQSEIAKRAGLTRQAISLYVSGKRNGGFPSPVCNLHDDHEPLWSWCDVAHWLSENDLVSSKVLDEAFTVDIINTHLDSMFQRATKPELTRKITESLDEECESCS